MHVASWRKYGKLADLGKLWFRVSSSVKDCQEKSGLSFVSYFLHLCFLLPSFHNLILGGYIRVLVPVSMIYLPINLDALVYSLTNLNPVYAPFGPKLQTKSLSYTPLVFFQFFRYFKHFRSFGGCACFMPQLGGIGCFKGGGLSVTRTSTCS